MKMVDPRRKSNWHVIMHLLSTSTLVWVLLGFSLAYLLFFYRPIYENSQHAMYFPRYVPTFPTVGVDLGLIIDWSRKWLTGAGNPYIDNYFFNPPLTVVLFAALSSLPFSLLFRIASGCTMIFFLFSAFLFPLAFTGKRSVSPVLLMLFVMGLMSYGFQFELERGQFNIAATGCALLAVLIYRAAPRYRLVAFLLFTLAVQLKIYPAIFIFLFVEDWSAWRRQLRDLAVILLMNILSLFALGVQGFVDFLHILGRVMAEPYIWIGNMSAKSFAAQALPDNPSLLLASIFCLYIICLAVSLWFFRRRPQNMARYYLFLVCTIGALIIPSISHDYKLPLLVAPVAILLDSISLSQQNPLLKIGRIACLVFCSAAFASTLFSYTNKIFIPGVGDTPISLLVQNNLPALMVLLVGFAFLVLTQNPGQNAPSTLAENTLSTTLNQSS
jgi:hypothetical protein